jgi:hypothetical protein
MRALASHPDSDGISSPTPRAHALPPFSSVEQGLATIEDGGPSGLSSGRLRDDLRWLAAQQCALEALQARWLAELDRRHDEHESSTLWLQENLGLTSGAAYARVRTARQLEQLPGTAAALRRGEINAQHVDVICRALGQIERTCLEPSSTERSLLEQARHTDAYTLHQHWLQLRYEADQEAGVAAEAEEHRRRWLNLCKTRSGTYRIEGMLDPENGALVHTALKALGGRRPEDDPRTPAQRRADDLGELARRQLDAGDLPRLGGEKPHLLLVAELSSLRLEPGSRMAQLDWGPLVTGPTARRIAEDADVTPVLVDEHGAILHVGRRTRSVSPRMRKALNLRDRRCQAPGCSATPDRCQVHHRRHWVDGGPTILPNLELRCTVHHARSHPENDRFRRAAALQPAAP